LTLDINFLGVLAAMPAQTGIAKEQSPPFPIGTKP
jgi:hypothetical protein